MGAFEYGYPVLTIVWDAGQSQPWHASKHRPEQRPCQVSQN